MRIRSIDLLKTCGIIAFIIWHCYVNYYGPHYDNSPIMRSTLFATGLFIFLSGTTIGYNYYGNNTAFQFNILRKIIIRCVKLLLIVFIANIAIGFTSGKNLNYAFFSNIVHKIVSILYVDRWDISLQVLLVIAVGMIINSMLLPWVIKCGASFAIIAFAPLVAVFIFDWDPVTHLPYFWRYLPLAYSGALAGVLTRKIRDNNSLQKDSFFWNSLFFLILFLALWSGACVSKEISHFIVYETIPYHLMIFSLFAGIGGIALRNLDGDAPFIFSRRTFYIIGEYSLFVYLLQIVLINISTIVIGAKKFPHDGVILIFATMIIFLCFGATLLLDRLRVYSPVNNLYRLIFC